MEKEEVTKEFLLQSEIISEKKPFWQNPKIPIVVAFVVFGLTILASGWLVWNERREKPIIPSTYFVCPDGSHHGPGIPSEGVQEWCKKHGYIRPAKEIAITTDKTEYRVGDSIVIRVENGLGKDICFGACSNCPSCHAYNLERKEGDESYEVVKRWSCGNEMNIIGERLKPGESTEFTTYYVSQNPQETARYRVAVLLSFDCSRISFELAQAAYSNEFTIKKLDLPLVLEKVNFYTYSSGEIVLGDGENTGETLVKRDLDGDSKEEEIYVDKVRFPEGIGFVLHIGGKNQKTDFWTTDFSVVDIDESDSYQEVVLHNPGPSNDDVSLFFWYNGQEIKEMGKLARWPKILGNGEVKVADWMGFWAKTDTYLLNEETHLLEWVPKETYEVGIKTKALGTVRLYKEKSYDSRIVKEIKQGEEVEILLAEGCDTYFCEWFQLEAGEIKGWAKQDDFEYGLELSHAD